MVKSTSRSSSRSTESDATTTRVENTETLSSPANNASIGNEDVSQMPSQSTPVRFKRLKPRVGTQFQIKVPKATTTTKAKQQHYESDRPNPCKMSKEYEFLTLEEVQEQEQKNVGRTRPFHVEEDAGHSKYPCSRAHWEVEGTTTTQVMNTCRSSSSTGTKRPMTQGPNTCTGTDTQSTVQIPLFKEQLLAPLDPYRVGGTRTHKRVKSESLMDHSDVFSPSHFLTIASSLLSSSSDVVAGCMNSAHIDATNINTNGTITPTAESATTSLNSFCQEMISSYNKLTFNTSTRQSSSSMESSKEPPPPARRSAKRRRLATASTTSCTGSSNPCQRPTSPVQIPMTVTPTAIQHTRIPISVHAFETEFVNSLEGEEEETLLTYLQQQYDGNLSEAEFSMRLQLSRGTARKARRIVLTQRRKDRFKCPPVQSSASWKQRLTQEWTFLGDLRPNAGLVAYPSFLKNGNHTADILDEDDESSSVPVMSVSVMEEHDDDDYKKGVWQSILVHGESLLKQANAASHDYGTLSPIDHDIAATNTKPSLSYVLHFLFQCNALPIPEDCFGSKHHNHLVEQLSDCFHCLLDHVSKARSVLAGWMDFLSQYESAELANNDKSTTTPASTTTTNTKHNDGVEIDALQKVLDDTSSLSPFALEEEAVLRRQVKLAVEWHERLEQKLSSKTLNEDHLALAMTMATEAQRSFCIKRMKPLVMLERRIEKALELRSRLIAWENMIRTTSEDENGYTKNNNKTMTVKQVASLVRDANRIALPCPRVHQLRAFHKELESWLDRATVAIRSRISLTELISLLSRAHAMPCTLQEICDKLQSRVTCATDWMEQLTTIVPCVYFNEDERKNNIPKDEAGIFDGEGGTVNHVAWMMKMRDVLANDSARAGGGSSRLFELCCEGARIPVEMTAMKMLQIEFDAKNWMAKAEKWVPVSCSSGGEPSVSSKKGKIEDLRDHLIKAEQLRDRLPFKNKEGWTLKYEKELRMIVEAADKWVEKFQPFLDVDNRRNNERVSLSLEKLKEIVTQGNAIHANIGNLVNKMSRILTQADHWFATNKSLLARAGVVERHTDCASNGSACAEWVTVLELTTAVSSASSDVSLELDEALALQNVIDKIQRWVERAGNAAPIKRSKRVGKGRWSCKPTRFRVQDLVELIEEASALPISTGEQVQRLKSQLNDVQSWRMKAQTQLKEISTGFRVLKESIQACHGDPEDFKSGEITKAGMVKVTKTDLNPPLVSFAEADSMIHVDEVKGPTITEMPIGNDSQVSAFASGVEIETPDVTDIKCNISEKTELEFESIFQSTVESALSIMLNEAQKTGVLTGEEDVAAALAIVAKWCTESLRMLMSQDHLYDKRSYEHFNSLVEAGKALVEAAEDVHYADVDEDLVRLLRTSWTSVIKDQLIRLEVLRSHRDEFLEWSKAAQSLMTTKEKKITLDVMDEMVIQSRKYPQTADIVVRIHGLSQRIIHWRETVTDLINCTEKKITMDVAKTLCEEGEKLKLACPELKMLKTAIKSARGWFSRVKRCKVEQGGTAANEVESLIEEHDSLLISMPEELGRVKRALKGYCLCRRPYEGFMIGCDGCDEWYHGPCVGVSESQADRYDKYLCVRCCVKRVFTSSSLTVASVIRKWTSAKDRKKARQADFQKHQRKVRKEKKDIEKIEAQIAELCQNAPSTMQTTFDARANVVCETPSAVEKEAISGNDHRVLDCGKDVSPIDIDTQQGTSSVMQSKGDTFGSNAAKNEAIATTEGGESKLKQLECAISDCRSRLEVLAAKAAEVAELEHQEDLCSERLKIWCIRVRALVLVPTTTDNILHGRPSADGSLSPSMLSLFKDAETLGIARFADVHQVANAFKAICWSSLAMTTLARRARLNEVQLLLNSCSTIDLPDEKAMRMLKSMIQRTIQWKLKTRKALAPKPGEKDPFDLEVLKELDFCTSSLPFEVPEAICLANAIDDKGCRHCVCGGANDGTFMLSCDKCENWFHGRCVGVDKEKGNDLGHWMCPPCCNGNANIPNVSFEPFEAILDSDDDESATLSEAAACAPTVEKLWPPFKLLGSAESEEALGGCCLAIPDVHGNLPMLEQQSIVVSQSQASSEFGSVPMMQSTMCTPFPIQDMDARKVQTNGDKRYTSKSHERDLKSLVQDGDVVKIPYNRLAESKVEVEDPMIEREVTEGESQNICSTYERVPLLSCQLATLQANH